MNYRKKKYIVQKRKVKNVNDLVCQGRPAYEPKQQLLEIEKEIVREVARVIKLT